MENRKILTVVLGLFLIATSGFSQDNIYRPDIKNREVITLDFYLPFGKTKEKRTIEVVNGIAVMEGDIVLGEIGKIMAQHAISIDGANYRWPGGQIPFTISNSFSYAKVAEINSAVQRINESTNLFLYPRSAEDDYVRFEPSTGNSSCIGRQGGVQQIHISIASNMNTIIHEVLHAAGFYHEQSREDRDEYIEILWENIQEGKAHNFEQHNSSATDIRNYDFCSIMHYSKNAFGRVINGRQLETIRCKRACPCLDGPRSLSQDDRIAINSVYPSRQSKPWQLLPGSAGKDIAVSPVGTAYLTNRKGNIYKYNGYEWSQMPGSDALNIAANKDRLWMVNNVGNIYEFNGNRWVQMPGSSGKDIAITSEGTVWLTNTNGNIYRYNEVEWTQMPGSDAVRIAAGQNSDVWIINKSGEIYRYSNGRWNKMPGSAGRDIAVGNDGTVWLTNSSGLIYKWNGAGWSQIYGSDGLNISVNNNNAYLVNTKGSIYKLEY